MREIHQGLELVLAVTLPTLASCASSTAGEPSPSELPTVEVVIHNETERAVTAYLQWVGSRATRLGVIASGSSATYLPTFRAGELCVSTTDAGNTSFSTAVPAREAPFQCQSGIPVERGQRMDVIVGPRGTCYLQHDPDC